MPKVYVYVDETGDRGVSPRSSPIFGMAAVLVPEPAQTALRDAVTQLRADFGVPHAKILSWKDFVTNHDRRRRAADVLAAVPGIRVCYVYARKSALRPDSYVSDRARFYNYVASKMYKSILWGSRSMGASEVLVRWSHVRHHDQEATRVYLEQLGRSDDKLPDELVESMRWVSADQYVESQAADLFGGFLKAATWPAGPYGYVEATYLKTIWHMLRNSDRCAIPLGIMSMPDYAVLTAEPWFPCAPCTKAP